MDKLRVSILQAKIKWHDPAYNLKHFDNLVSDINETDLIVLPEMWSTGYTMMAHRFDDSLVEAIELMKRHILQQTLCCQ